MSRDSRAPAYKCRMLKYVLKSSGQVVAEVTEYSPLRFQLLLELQGDTLPAKEKMISKRTVEVFRTKGLGRGFPTITYTSLIGSEYLSRRKTVSVGFATTRSGIGINPLGHPRRRSPTILPACCASIHSTSKWQPSVGHGEKCFVAIHR